MNESRDKITVYYDGACPKCVDDRRQYEKLAGKGGGVVWFDITGKDDELRAIGIDPRKALTELHVRDENRQVLSEIDAYVALMRRVPVLKPLAWLIGLPLLRPWLGRVYRRRVEDRLRREGRL